MSIKELVTPEGFKTWDAGFPYHFFFMGKRNERKYQRANEHCEAPPRHTLYLATTLGWRKTPCPKHTPLLEDSPLPKLANEGMSRPEHFVPIENISAPPAKLKCPVRFNEVFIETVSQPNFSFCPVCILYSPLAVDSSSGPQETSHMVISISDSVSQETTYNTWQVRERKLVSMTHLPSIFNSFPLSFPSPFIHTYMHVTSNDWEPSMKQELDLTSFTKRCLGVFFICIHSIWGSRHFLAWHLLSFLEISLSLSLCMLLLSLYLLPFWNPKYKYIRP